MSRKLIKNALMSFTSSQLHRPNAIVGKHWITPSLPHHIELPYLMLIPKAITIDVGCCCTTGRALILAAQRSGVYNQEQFPVETAVDRCHPIEVAARGCSSETGTCSNRLGRQQA